MAGSQRWTPRRLARAGPLVGALAALVLTAPVIGGRPPAGEDVMAHLVRADFAISHLVGEGRLDGWFPRLTLGHQEFLFNGPGLTWLIALVRGVSFGAMSNAGALKVVVVASFAAVPPALWFLARSFGAGRRAAGIAAVLAPLVSGPYGPGLDGTFVIGLVSHQVGAVLFLVTFGACLRALEDPRRRWLGLGAVSLAGLLVTHVISVLILGVMLALTVALRAVRPPGGRGPRRARRLSWEGIGRLTLTGVAAGGLAGFWLVPVLAHRDLRGFTTTWGNPTLLHRLGAILTGDELLPPGLLVAVVAAGWWCAAGGPDAVPRRPLTLAAGVPAVYLLGAHAAPHMFGFNEVTLQLANRGLGYAGLLAVVPLAVFLASATRSRTPRVQAGLLVGLAVIAVAVAPGRNAVGQMPEPVPALRAAAGELARRVPDGARFATERDYPAEIRRTGVIHPELWLARTSGRNSLNGFNLESSSTARASLEPYRLGKRPAAASARALARLGVSHVVTTTARLSEELAASNAFRLEWRRAPISILALRAPSGAPPAATLLSSLDPFDGRLLAAAPEHLAFEVSAPEPVPVTVAVAWSPKWSGSLTATGRPLRLDRTSDGLIRVDLPEGSTRFALDYRTDRWDRLGVALSIVSIVTLLGFARRRRRAARRESTAGPSGQSAHAPGRFRTRY